VNWSVDIEGLLSADTLGGELEGFGPEAPPAGADLLARAAERRRPGMPAILIESFGRRMRLAVINDDMPFLVDPVAAKARALLANG